jgi:hypothetical protein
LTITTLSIADEFGMASDSTHATYTVPLMAAIDGFRASWAMRSVLRAPLALPSASNAHARPSQWATKTELRTPPSAHP